MPKVLGKEKRPRTSQKETFLKQVRDVSSKAIDMRNKKGSTEPALVNCAHKIAGSRGLPAYRNSNKGNEGMPRLRRKRTNTFDLISHGRFEREYSPMARGAEEGAMTKPVE